MGTYQKAYSFNGEKQEIKEDKKMRICSHHSVEWATLPYVSQLLSPYEVDLLILQ
jgi:hypothetical protein